MSGLELNKIAGAILSAALLAMVVGIVGDALVHPKQHTSSVVVAEAPAPAAPKKEEPLEPIGPLLASASVEAGQKEANKCKACHTFEKGGQSKVGPPLWNVVGSQLAHTEGYSYSSALAGKGGSWDYEALNKFLHKPRDYVPGTKMAFAGVRNAKDRAELIVYLRSLSDEPKPLP